MLLSAAPVDALARRSRPPCRRPCPAQRTADALRKDHDPPISASLRGGRPCCKQAYSIYPDIGIEPRLRCHGPYSSLRMVRSLPTAGMAVAAATPIWPVSPQRAISENVHFLVFRQRKGGFKPPPLLRLAGPPYRRSPSTASRTVSLALPQAFWSLPSA